MVCTRNQFSDVCKYYLCLILLFNHKRLCASDMMFNGCYTSWSVVLLGDTSCYKANSAFHPHGVDK